jgi:hypothetical protein
MKSKFLTRQAFVKFDGKLHKISIAIGRPFASNSTRGFCNFSCDVSFQNVEKYNTNIKGIDEMHSIECAIAYINSICRNSVEPEFFHKDGESMLFNEIES